MICAFATLNSLTLNEKSVESAMPEVAANAALLVNPLDTEAIRNGILKLIHDDNCRNQLIQNGFENAKRFDVKVIANQYLELYKKVYNNG